MDLIHNQLFVGIRAAVFGFVSERNDTGYLIFVRNGEHAFAIIARWYPACVAAEAHLYPARTESDVFGCELYQCRSYGCILDPYVALGRIGDNYKREWAFAYEICAMWLARSQCGKRLLVVHPDEFPRAVVLRRRSPESCFGE